jgi:hypothetical protein
VCQETDKKYLQLMERNQEKIEPNVSNSSGTDDLYVWINGNRRQYQFNSVWRYLGGVTRKAHRRWLIHHHQAELINMSFIP